MDKLDMFFLGIGTCAVLVLSGEDVFKRFGTVPVLFSKGLIETPYGTGTAWCLCDEKEKEECQKPL